MSRHPTASPIATTSRGLAGRVIRDRLMTLVLLAGLPATTTDAADAPQFRFARQIDAPAVEQDELLSVTLDADIYAGTRDDLNDLRIVDADGRSLPHIVRLVTTTETKSVRRFWTPDEVSARPLDDGGLEILIRLDDDDPSVHGVLLDSPLRDFERQIRIETSIDGTDWQPAAESLIFDYSRFIDVRRDAISVPATSHRHLRIVIENVTATQASELLELTRTFRGGDEVERRQRSVLHRQPFRINQVRLWTDDERPGPPTAVPTSYPPLSVQISQDDEADQTFLVVEARREPLTQFTLQMNDRNVSRTVRVEVQEQVANQAGWRMIAQTQVTRIDFKDLQIEQLSISIPESRHDRYRLVIDNEQNPPLDLTGVSASGNTYEAVFLATPGQQLHLHYGNPGVAAAELDTAPLAELLRRGYQPLAASLGPQEQLTSGPLASQDRWPRWLASPAVLVGVITVLVILLALALYQAARRIDIDNAADTSPWELPPDGS